MGTRLLVVAVIHEINQCAGIKIQLPGRNIISMNLRSPTNGVSLLVRFAGKQPSQFAGSEVCTDSGIIVKIISPSTGKKQVQVENVFLNAP